MITDGANKRDHKAEPNAGPKLRSTDGLGALRSKQIELLREVWGLTVERSKALNDIDDIAREWKHLADELREYSAEAYQRYELHAPNIAKVSDSGEGKL